MKYMLFLSTWETKMSANVPNVRVCVCEKIATASLERNLVIYKFYFIYIFFRNSEICIWWYEQWWWVLSCLKQQISGNTTCPSIRDGEIIVIYTYDRKVHSS